MAFREDFVWGAASSAYQTEGFPSADGGGESIWDAFCRRPGAIANGDNGSIACDGYISSLSALFGCLPNTSFSQNVGLIAMTKVINRFTIATGAGIMILAGLFPIFGALLNTLPEAVLGGCTIIMFGNIVISGLQMISNCGFSQRNITIAALSLSVGIGFTQVPEIFSIFPDVVQNVFADNCVATVFLIAIIANLVLPKEKE